MVKFPSPRSSVLLLLIGIQLGLTYLPFLRNRIQSYEDIATFLKRAVSPSPHHCFTAPSRFHSWSLGCELEDWGVRVCCRVHLPAFPCPVGALAKEEPMGCAMETASAPRAPGQARHCPGAIPAPEGTSASLPIMALLLFIERH